jgi:hypothetical protein
MNLGAYTARRGRRSRFARRPTARPAGLLCDAQIHLESLADYPELLAGAHRWLLRNSMITDNATPVCAGSNGSTSTGGRPTPLPTRAVGRLRLKIAAAPKDAVSERFP